MVSVVLLIVLAPSGPFADTVTDPIKNFTIIIKYLK
jgi:hypothetical protein